LIFYEHAITLFREIEYIWGTQLNAVSLLFYLNRSVAVIWAICGLLGINAGPLANESSLLTAAPVNLQDILELILLTLWAAFSSIRMYAISGGGRCRSLIVLLLNIVPIGTNAVL
ncbi:hypothetical protein OBBRIDRAFT_694657, partial [Obba rivulosa]